MSTWYVIVFALSAIAGASGTMLTSPLTEENRCACVGERLVYQCSVPSAAVQWQVPMLGITSDFARSHVASGREDTQGPFEFRAISFDDVNGVLTSTATVTATADLNGTTLGCVDLEVANGVVVTSTLCVDELSPPTLSLDESSLVSVSNKRWRFTLEWEPQTERTVTGYVIAVDPPLSGGQCSTCVINRNATSFPFELGLNVQHDFMIRRINCNGTVADTPGGDFRVMFLEPDSPTFSTTVIYNKTDVDVPATLTSIAVTWPPVVPQTEISPTVLGSIRGYESSVIGRSSEVLLSVKLNSSCTDLCSFEADVTTFSGQAQYRVAVAARNALGLGDATTTGTYSAENDIVDLNFTCTTGTLLVECTTVFGELTFRLANDSSFTGDVRTTEPSPQCLQVTISGLELSSLYFYEATVYNSDSRLTSIMRGSFVALCDAPPEIENTESSSGSETTTVVIIIVCVVLAVVAFVSVVGIVVIVIVRRNRRPTLSPLELLPRPYIQPSTTVLQKGSKVIPQRLLVKSSQLRILGSSVIGQGEFGVVYKAHFIKGSQKLPQIVAVKTLRGLFTYNDVQSMLSEVVKMDSVGDHPNVMPLLGVCMDAGPGISLIMPFMEQGSLLEYLRKERNSLVIPEDQNGADAIPVMKLLLRFCYQIAAGMSHLAKQKFVHRDLAARNCMLDGAGNLKVADFGLGENMYTSGYYRQDKDAHLKLPYKWMAPESLDDGVFSEKTDVWAYGVTCWEIFTGGKIPYPGIPPSDVVKQLVNGTRLEKPDNAACSVNTYQVMLKCWHANPTMRPSFCELTSLVENTLMMISDYLEIGMNFSPTPAKEPVLENDGAAAGGWV